MMMMCSSNQLQPLNRLLTLLCVNYSAKGSNSVILSQQTAETASPLSYSVLESQTVLLFFPFEASEIRSLGKHAEYIRLIFFIAP